ncbi:hypothetical protein CALCODRAFT_104571 [Calocera cornea HHB12733]|uniref:F-box domain-containing protein n=1 Tax=Calocera cornea HHB12733 TaxID=1353952 RepID=A0A165D425_9BASI|nr:hypothetical protein CALCODRAFT_104571 [Calocera cornea HHB12733]
MSIASPRSKLFPNNINNILFLMPDTALPSLNDDILLEIFSYCRDVEPVTIWVVSHTCRQWRRVALEHSLLWTHIVVDRTTARYLGSTSALLWLDTWLQRAGPERDLDVVLNFTNISKSRVRKAKSLRVGSILLLASHHAYRWRTLTYTLMGEDGSLRTAPQGVPASQNQNPMLNELRKTLANMPRLQSVCFSQNFLSQGSPDITPQYVHSLLSPKAAPRLRRVALTNIVANNDAVSCWPMEELSYTFIGDSVLVVDLAAPLLHKYAASRLRLSGSPGALPLSQTDVPTLERLEVLTADLDVYLAEMVRHAPMPYLSELILLASNPRDPLLIKQNMQAHDRYSLQLLDELSQRPSASILKKISLSLPFRDIPWSSIAQFDGLEVLRIVKPSTDIFWLQYPSPLSMLYNPSTKPLGWVLPQLRLLFLEETEPYTFTRFGLTGGADYLVSETKRLFQRRSDVAKGSAAMTASLSIHLVGLEARLDIQM